VQGCKKAGESLASDDIVHSDGFRVLQVSHHFKNQGRYFDRQFSAPPLSANISLSKHW
jgi:hypothetical protein